MRHADTERYPGVPTGSVTPLSVSPSGTQRTPSARNRWIRDESGGELAVAGEAIGVREAGVGVRRGEGGGDAPAGRRAPAEGAEQHPSHVPRLGRIDPGSRAVLGLEVVDESARLGSCGGPEIDACARHDGSVTGTRRG